MAEPGFTMSGMDNATFTLGPPNDEHRKDVQREFKAGSYVRSYNYLPSYPAEIYINSAWLTYLRATKNGFDAASAQEKSRFWVNTAIVLGHEVAHVGGWLSGVPDEPLHVCGAPEAEHGYSWENAVIGGSIWLTSLPAGDFGMYPWGAPNGSNPDDEAVMWPVEMPWILSLLQKQCWTRLQTSRGVDIVLPTFKFRVTRRARPDPGARRPKPKPSTTSKKSQPMRGVRYQPY
ncbi:hypothetical protein LTS18_006403 [Coniosporium uncinatum]|uniref:Uncharacterized protein n=1 Tax=Coniosporium uncinatum TaxID=93489 RepID=A0ACC3D3N6_9PEZI|nr:hypothetical protein LTS18_006403 [Coniosporium uncinatum]